MNYCKCGCGSEISDNATWKPGHWARSKNAKKILSDNGKRTGGWNKGIPRTEEEKQKIQKGISAEGKKRMAEAAKNRWNNGTYSFMYGKTNPSCNPKVGKKIGEANRIRKVKDSTRAKLRNNRLGRPGNPISEENKKKSSLRMKERNPMFNKEVLKNHPVLKSGPHFHSVGEDKVGKMLKGMGLKFSYQHLFKKEKGFYVADFFLPDYQIIIEFDGHHSHIENAQRDQDRDKYIKDHYGISTIRLLPSDMNNNQIEKTKDKIRKRTNENKEHKKIVRRS